MKTKVRTTVGVVSQGRIQEGGWGGCNPLFFRRRHGNSAESERSHALSRYTRPNMRDHASTLRTYRPPPPEVVSRAKRICECASGARAKERGEEEKYVWCICTGFCALAECNYKYTTRNNHMTSSQCTTQSHFSFSGGSYGYRLRW